MATQEMQIPKIAAGSPVIRWTSVILAVAVALTIGAVIGRETAGKTEAVARPASTISFVGTDSADAARRAEVYQAMAALDAPIAFVGTNSADAARRAQVYQAMEALRARGESFGSVGQQLSDAERRALVYRLVTQIGG